MKGSNKKSANLVKIVFSFSPVGSRATPGYCSRSTVYSFKLLITLFNSVPIGIIRPLIRLYKPLLVNFAALVIVLPCLFILLTGYILYSAELSDRELNYCSAFWLNSSNNNNNFILCTKIQILNGLPRK